MTKVEHTADARVLVGIDISKHRHEVLVAVPSKTRRRRLTISNTTEDFTRLMSILRDYGLPVRIGFEATGNYHRVLMYHLGMAGFDLKLVTSVASLSVPSLGRTLITTGGKIPWQVRSVVACCDAPPVLEPSQYLSIRYTERLAEAGIEPSVGSVRDSYDCEYGIAA